MAKKSKTGFEITPELIQTLIEHPEIKEVYVNAKGKHMLHAYPHGGQHYGMIVSEEFVGNDKKKNIVKTPMLNTRVIEILSREDILGTQDK